MDALEKIAFRVVSMEESDLVLLGIATYVIGFAIGFFRNKDRYKSIQRAPFFFLHGLAYFAASCVALLWLLSEPAVEYGALWLVVAAVFILLGVIGYYWAIACIYRSRDAFNTPFNAWLGLIPLVNLYLILSASKEPRKNPISFTPVIEGGTGVFLGFLLFFLASIPTEYVERAASEYEKYVGTEQYMTEWAETVKAENSLPQKLPNGIIWQDVYHLPALDALVYKYVGSMEKSAVQAYGGELWKGPDGAAIKAQGFDDILFVFINDYNREEMGTYSCKYSRWFRSVREYASYAQ